MKHPNINLKAIPEGMSIAQASEVLRDQREEERRKLIFGLAMAAAATPSGYEDLTRSPESAADDIADYVDYLQIKAYGNSVTTKVDPTQILASEVAQEYEDTMKMSFWEEPVDPEGFETTEEMPGCPLGCTKSGCEHPTDCKHQED